MSDNRRKIVINQQQAIDWELVYLAFEKRFIESHYEPWRRQFNMDACNQVAQRTDLQVGNIVPLWLPAVSGRPPHILNIDNYVQTYYGEDAQTHMRVYLMLCDGTGFDPEEYQELKTILTYGFTPVLHKVWHDDAIRPQLQANYLEYNTHYQDVFQVDSTAVIQFKNLPLDMERWVQQNCYHEHFVTPSAGTKLASAEPGLHNFADFGGIKDDLPKVATDGPDFRENPDLSVNPPPAEGESIICSRQVEPGYGCWYYVVAKLELVTQEE